jgi:NitT/TauT family transport system substrate-binding protein
MRRIAVLAVTVVLLAVAGCTSEDKKADPVGTKVGLGVIPIVDVAPVYLGKSKGFFSSRGIDLNLVPEQGGPAIVKGVLAGTYEFGFSNVTSLMAAETGDLPLKAVANGVASTGRPYRDFSAIVVPYGSPIRSAAELAGKTIAVNALKSLGDTTVRASVRKAGGDPTGIQFEAMPFSAMPGALQAGEVDGAWIVEPQLSEAITLGGQVIASNFVDTAPDLTVAMYFTATGLIDRDPELVARFTAAVKESLAYAAGHPDEVRTAVGTYTKISDTVRISMALPNWPDEINRPSLERLALLGQQDGIFTRAPALDKLLPAAGP